MKHLLSSLFPNVKLKLIPFEFQLFGNFFGGKYHLADQLLVRIFQCHNRIHVPAGDYKYVCFRLWPDIVERDTEIILKHPWRWYLAGNDLAKNTIHIKKLWIKHRDYTNRGFKKRGFASPQSQRAHSDHSLLLKSALRGVFENPKEPGSWQ